MGNCQAAEVSAVVIQHPGGKIERLYWPTTAQEVMKNNPGHHVALVTLCVAQAKQEDGGGGSGGGGSHVRFTRVRLLKPKDMLMIGQVYRLITSQEVSKALEARELEKMRKTQSESIKKQRQQLQLQQQQQIQNARVDHSIEVDQEAGQIELGRTIHHHHQVEKQEGERQKSAGSSRPRHWQPTLQSISESVS